jgi:hypothetical protein
VSNFLFSQNNIRRSMVIFGTESSAILSTIFAREYENCLEMTNVEFQLCKNGDR